MAEEAKKVEEKISCGIVMPISDIDGCSAEHWNDVLEIINEAMGDENYDVRLVSASDDVGVIQKRIVQNLYQNDIVICDVSAKNANVMFELGMRLAFDKPTIIIKDDATKYSFDTSPIEHLEYPRDLRFATIVEFKTQLLRKVEATLKKAKDDKNFSTFLGHFGTFSLPKIESKEVSGDQYIIEELKELKRSIARMNLRKSRHSSGGDTNDEVLFALELSKGIDMYRTSKKISKSKLFNHRNEIQDAMIEKLRPQRIYEDVVDYERAFERVFNSKL